MKKDSQKVSAEIAKMEGVTGAGARVYAICRMCGKERGLDYFEDKDGNIYEICADCAEKRGFKKSDLFDPGATRE